MVVGRADSMNLSMVGNGTNNADCQYTFASLIMMLASGKGWIIDECCNARCTISEG
jgi:hypothetical protein